MAERRRDCTLASRRDVEERQREPLALLRQRTRGRRQPFTLGKGALECLQTFAGKPCLLPERFALCAHTGVEYAPRARQLCSQPFEQRLRTLAAELQSLARAAQAVQRRRRLLAAACSVGKLLFRAAAFLEERVESLVGMLAGEHRRGAPALAVLEAFAQVGKIELCNSRPERREVAEQLLSALGGGRLECQRAQPFLHLGLDVTRALDLDRDTRELELRAMLAPLEAAEPRGFLQKLAPLLRLRPEDLLHPALADDRVHPAAEPEIGEQLDEIDAADRRAVEEVLALAPTVQPAGNRELGVRQRPLAVGIVEEKLDLAEILGRPSAAAGEEDVVRLLGPKL